MIHSHTPKYKSFFQPSRLIHNRYGPESHNNEPSRNPPGEAGPAKNVKNKFPPTPVLTENERLNQVQGNAKSIISDAFVNAICLSKEKGGLDMDFQDFADTVYAGNETARIIYERTKDIALRHKVSSEEVALLDLGNSLTVKISNTMTDWWNSQSAQTQRDLIKLDAVTANFKGYKIMITFTPDDNGQINLEPRFLFSNHMRSD